ncbi:MAG: hypothetical protein ABIR62_06550 [Dokdonella sp.]|uniref:hypothetical protein n=1 Tax=Dokdonella sp. TaxID=2291710 RepID=UPI003265D62E
MDNYLVWAAVLAVLIGLVHSALGEILIFRKLRSGSLIPSRGAPPLSERHIRILWATWHVVTVFGFALAAVLFQLGSATTVASARATVLTATGVAFLMASIVVLIGTHGRHPGWAALAGVAVLVALGLRAA